MVVITEEGPVDCRIRINRLQAEEVRIASLDVKHAALPRKGFVVEGAEKLSKPVKLIAHFGAVGDVAEILWAIVMGDVGGMRPIGVRRITGGIRRLIRSFLVETLLIPAERHRRLAEFGDESD